jgi:hypothetical protein
MRIPAVVVATLAVSAFTRDAIAVRPCGVDLEPLLSVHFIRDVSNDTTGEGHAISGELLVSRGGAVTILRTDTACCDRRPTRTFVSGQLQPQQLQSLQRALEPALAGTPVSCFVPGFDDPRPGQSTFGGSEFTLYRGGNTPLRLNVQHSDPDVPVPQCDDRVAMLDSQVIALEDSLQHGALPLQCVPYRP